MQPEGEGAGGRGHRGSLDGVLLEGGLPVRVDPQREAKKLPWYANFGASDANPMTEIAQLGDMKAVAGEIWAKLVGEHTLTELPVRRGPLARAVRAMSQGTVLMIGVVVLFSMTSVLDKIGAKRMPPLQYASLQRIVMAAPWAVHIAQNWTAIAHDMDKGLDKERSDFRNTVLKIACISIAECLTFVLYLAAVSGTLLVSYAIACKRCSILISVAIGRFYWMESLEGRLPYPIMVAGMLLILLAAGHG